MINIELTKAEALLYMEMLKRNTSEMLDQIAENMDEVMTQEEMSHAARKNYQTNVENEAKKVAGLEAEVQQLRAQIDAKNLSAKSNTIRARKALTPDSPWGFKKDGTPKKRPGRAPRA
jgi:multidrug resistance efflux pump